MGIMLSLNGQGWAVQTVDANGHAIQAGITKGDKPIVINGQPAQDFLEKYSEAKVVFGQAIRELTVVDDQRQLKTASLKDSPQSLESIIELSVWFTVCLSFWLTHHPSPPARSLHAPGPP